ncbi:hypothetical protein LINPERHAP1_LOCUS27289 [Linum perenne]
MAPFDFNSKSHFLASSDGTTLQVYEFNHPKDHPSSIQKTDLKEVAQICADLESVAAGISTSLVYNGLAFSNDRAKIKGEEALAMLAQHLAHLRLMVSPEGCCFQDVTELEMYAHYEIYYLRLNDLFPWSHYGVNKDVATIGWPNRSELKHHMPRTEEKLMSSSRRNSSRYVRVWREDYEDLKQKVRDQEDEIEDLKDDRAELKDTRQRNKDLRQELREKKSDIVYLEDKVEKLKKELKEAKKRKQKDDDTGGMTKADEEQHKKRRTTEEKCKKKHEEQQESILRIQKEKDEEEAKCKKKYEEQQGSIQRIQKEKDDEEAKCKKKHAEQQESIQRLQKEKDEEEAKAKRLEAELKIAKEKIGQRPKYSWENLRDTKFLPDTPEGKAKHMLTRRKLPSNTFSYAKQIPSNNYPYYYNSQQDYQPFWNKVYIVDEDSNAEWPLPPETFVLYSTQNENSGFDVDNWYMCKTTQDDGRLTMIAYYDDGQWGPNATPNPYNTTVRWYHKLTTVHLSQIGSRRAFHWRVYN